MRIPYIQTCLRPKNLKYVFPVFLIYCLAFFPSWVSAARKQATEYELKMAFLYNFLKYVEWPKEKGADESHTKETEADPKKEPASVLIGVVGKDPFGKAWEIVQDKKINEQKIVYQIFTLPEGEEEQQKKVQEEMVKCQVLFIPKSEEKNLGRILDLVKGHPVLTVSEMDDFLEKGGIINFVMEDNKIRFEINLDAAKPAQVQFKTAVLKLAKRIVQSKEKPEK
jgi:hypothetical protein